MKLGIIGGGSVGQKLAELSQAAGHNVVIGQRDTSKAATGTSWHYGSLKEAVTHGELVILAIPYLACAEVLAPLADMLAGKIVIDATNPLNPDWSPVLLGEENSAGEEISRLLPRSRVVKAFNTVFADIMTPSKLGRHGRPASLFLCGDDEEVRATVSRFAASLGFAPVDAGPLRCARYLEGMAHLNIQLAVGQGGGTDAAFLYDRG
jgi:8-hydroxy-5-deazaflavin:NADPH oxidoreductase